DFKSKSIDTTEDQLKISPEEEAIRPQIKADIEEKISVEEFVEEKLIPKDAPELSPKDVSETTIQVSKPKAIKLKRRTSEEVIATETKIDFKSKSIDITEEDQLKISPEEEAIRPQSKADIEEKVSVEEFVEEKLIPKEAPELSPKDVSETTIQVSKPKAIKLKRRTSEEVIATETKIDFKSKSIDITEEDQLKISPKEEAIRPQ